MAKQQSRQNQSRRQQSRPSGDDGPAMDSNTVGVFRTAATVKGGRRFSFSSMVVVGDRNGRVGMGYGKANQVPPAIEKATKEAKRRLRQYPLQGRTIPHTVVGRFGACKVLLRPASPGTGVIAGAAVRAPLEMLGIQDCLTKSFGSSNSKNLVKAVFDGLEQLRSKQRVEELRGVTLEQTTVEESIERSRAFLATGPATEKPSPAANGASQTDSESGAKGGRGGHGKAEASRGNAGEPQTGKTGTEPAAEQTPKSAEPAPKKDEQTGS